MTTLALARDYEPGPFWDEAYDAVGAPRPGYAELLDAVHEAGPARHGERRLVRAPGDRPPAGRGDRHARAPAPPRRPPLRGHARGALKRIAVLYRRTDEDRLHRLAQRILAEVEANSSQGGGAKDTWIVPDATA